MDAYNQRTAEHAAIIAESIKRTDIAAACREAAQYGNVYVQPVLAPNQYGLCFRWVGGVIAEAEITRDQFKALGY